MVKGKEVHIMSLATSEDSSVTVGLLPVRVLNFVHVMNTFNKVRFGSQFYSFITR